MGFFYSFNVEPGGWGRKPPLVDGQGRPVLSLSETVMLRRLARGQTIAAAARQLGIVANTAAALMYRARKRFGVETNAELIAVATERGLLAEGGA